MARQRPSVDPAKTRNAVAAQLLVEAPFAAGVADVGREFAHHQRPALDAS
jgi:hypothetical protein